MPAKITPEECKNLCKDCTTCCDYATIKIPPKQKMILTKYAGYYSIRLQFSQNITNVGI